MPQDNSLHVGQTDAGAFKFFSPVQPLENAEQSVRVRHVEAHAVIFDEDHNLVAVALRGSDFD